MQSQSARIDELETQMKTVQTTAQNGTMQEQAMCSQQAEHTFLAMGYSRQRKDNGSDDFTSHYQPATRRCFMKIESSHFNAKTHQMVVSKYVGDAIGGEPLGSYMWLSQNDKKYWEVPPGECNVIDLKGEKQYCKSDDEFADLAKQYMN